MVSQKNRTHGDTGSPTYWAWAGMKTRCNNPSRDHAKYYKDKGITYCARWEFYEQFVKDMGKKPDGMTLDRIDGSKGYYKENCRWATSREQWDNRDDPRIETHYKRKAEVKELEELFKDL